MLRKWCTACGGVPGANTCVPNTAVAKTHRQYARPRPRAKLSVSGIVSLPQICRERVVLAVALYSIRRLPHSLCMHTCGSLLSKNCLAVSFQPRLLLQGWIIDAMEILVVAFVLENIAITFELGSVGKGLIGSASFFGERLSG